MSIHGMKKEEEAPTEAVEPRMEQATLLETMLDKSTIFATILDSVLSTSMAFPHLLKAYLKDGNAQLFTNGIKSDENATSEKMTLLKYLFNKFPIDQKELPSFLQLSICKLELKHLPIDEQLQMRILQNDALSKIANFDVVGNRLIELSNSAQHFLNIFYIYC
uniref:Uncharacterized protein n=1 Tax=Panagrolaimus sp. PS1159 TaxID=55785 RepID=A0AC35GWT0_9BILA